MSMYKMNKDHIKLLIDALRSGEYTQIKGCLHGSLDQNTARPGHCCLGVAIEVAVKELGLNIPKTKEERSGNEIYSFYGGGVLSEYSRYAPVVEFFGFPNAETTFLVDKELLQKLEGKIDRDKWARLKHEDMKRASFFTTLPALNDSMGFTFEEIAAVLECEPNFLTPEEIEELRADGNL